MNNAPLIRLSDILPRIVLDRKQYRYEMKRTLDNIWYLGAIHYTRIAAHHCRTLAKSSEIMILKADYDTKQWDAVLFYQAMKRAISLYGNGHADRAIEVLDAAVREAEKCL